MSKRRQVKPRMCMECGKPSHCVSNAGVGICCWDSPTEPLGPEESLVDETHDAPESIPESWVRFMRTLANEANYNPRRPGGEQLVWNQYPQIHVTAAKLLKQLETGDEQ